MTTGTWTVIGAGVGFLAGAVCGCGSALSVVGAAGHGDYDLAKAVLFISPVWGAGLGAILGRILGWVVGRRRYEVAGRTPRVFLPDRAPAAALIAIGTRPPSGSTPPCQPPW